jgi:uncharacterized protein YeaO (DUF488 family)
MSRTTDAESSCPERCRWETSAMPVRTKRWNDPQSPDDGFRLLICRYRPRGVPKQAEPWDGWCTALAPSKELHAAAYGKNDTPPIGWDEYARRFLAEVKAHRYWIDSFAARVREGGTITLLCSSACEDPARCHRSLVQGLIEEVAASGSTRAAVMRRRSD